MITKKPVTFYVNDKYEILKVDNVSKILSFSENFKDERLVRIIFHKASTKNFLIKDSVVYFKLISKTGILNFSIKTRSNSILKTKLFEYTMITNQLLYSDKNDFSFPLNAIVDSCEKKIVNGKAHYYISCKYIAKDSLKIVNNGRDYDGLKI